MSKWLSWQPEDTRIMAASAEAEPTKPTKPSFGSFSGDLSGKSQIIMAAKPIVTEATKCPGPWRCAGCYSVGMIDERERFIHPPKASEEWRDWLRKWEPKGGRTQ